MAIGTTTAVFYQEVIDKIAQNPPDVGDLIVLRDLCEKVEAGDNLAASRLTRDLVKLEGPEDPLHSISYELYHALMAKMLMQAWFDDYELLLFWQQTWFGSEEKRVAGNWDGVVAAVRAELQPFGRSITLSGREEDWERALNALKGAFRHLAKVKLPPVILSPGAPPEGPTYDQRVLPESLKEAVEEFFRLLQTLFQHTLEFAIARLERDGTDVQALWKLAALQDRLRDVLNTLTLPKDRLHLGLQRRIRVAEVRYGGGPTKPHRFLDAFPRFDARSVIFNSLDREDRDQPDVRGERPASIIRARDLQLKFCFDIYGHPLNPKDSPTPRHTRRRALITGKHSRQLTLKDDDDFITFMANYYDDELADAIRRKGSAADVDSGEVWRTAVNPWSLYAAQFTSHSRLNLTEGPPNYLTHAFPRNIAGRLFHDCGVYAVRAAYTLLSVLERIKQKHSEHVGEVRARWVRLPLHVGVFIESNFGVVLQHNQHLDVIDTDGVDAVWEEWIAKKPDSDTDPEDPDEALLKFHEDLSASAFSSDLDMPISSTPVLDPKEPVTKKTIWNSYQKKVVPKQLFSPLVGAPNAPQYQFDIRYLKLSELEREWYNKFVLQFWNHDCKDAWTTRQKTLTDPNINKKKEELTKHKKPYIEALQKAVDALIDSYKAEIKKKKEQLNQELDADKKKLLLPRIRVVASERIGTVLSAVRQVQDHIKEVSDPESTFPADFVPTFARPEEELLEMP